MTKYQLGRELMVDEHWMVLAYQNNADIYHIGCDEEMVLGSSTSEPRRTTDFGRNLNKSVHLVRGYLSGDYKCWFCEEVPPHNVITLSKLMLL